MRVYLYQMRPVLFLFYIVETAANMVLIHFYLKTFVFVNLALMGWVDLLTQYMYMVCFYIFTVLTTFASINLCTGNHCSIVQEVVRPLLGFLTYTICSLMVLGDAKSDIYVLYSDAKPGDLLRPEKPMHPYFDNIRIQATISLVTSVIFLLHCLIALDVLLSNEDSDDEHSSENSKPSDPSDDIVDELDYVPVRLYVLGGVVQRWLEQYQWFQDFTRNGVSYI
ncbi:uncharacterized protein LOC108023740 [Drosophila biarmipes]|uniref:uncharacterized protein LOC108023740 n=1 Tax=Drosophila biarmipes TaxID=125945 RepID=UPI0007E6AF8B|nr:uncharacterized protein LOC108023740 [Drosophila biarmipes]